VFFIDAVAVPPNRFRPVIELGSLKTEHPQTTIFKKVIQYNNELIELNKETSEEADVEEAAEEKPAAKKGKTS
jgi:DNA-directed RNA polymerase beta' subunit